MSKREPKYAYRMLSTDTKPSKSIPGYSLIETDTGNEFEWTGSEWKRLTFGGIKSIHIEEGNTDVVNQYLHQHTATATTLAVATVGDGTEYQITVVSAVGFIVGDHVHLEDGAAERTHPQIKAIVGNVLDLDRRIDKAHPIGADVTKVELDLSSAIGTLPSPQEYWIQPNSNEVWHLTRILISMTHSSAGDLGLFGNLSALANGVLLRARIDGQYSTLTNWKTNADIKLDMYDVDFDTRSGGGGTFGTSGRGSFDRAGAVVALNGATNDRLEVYIQDDITALATFKINAQGHPVNA
jgi:hypothetical protein